MKTLLGFILPITVIFAICVYFIYLIYFQPNAGNLSYFQNVLKIYNEHLALIIIAIVAYLYMQILVPKIWGKKK
jgi:hypothetical protein